MHMPEMDGAQLARKIKALHPQLPIILLSSIGSESYRMSNELFSCAVMKPVRRNELKTMISNQFSTSNSTVETRPPSAKLSPDFAETHPLDILIAEDNPVNQTLIMMVMKKLGYTAAMANNGVEAVEAMQSKNYDLVLMDMQMPLMDGLEATAAIRKLDIPQPVIIALTANAMQGDREICIEAGMDDFITKPLALDKLVAVLERFSAQIKVERS
jgi:CheY-like chemotaxis protein